LTPILLILGANFWWVPLALYIAYSAITFLGLSLKKGIQYFPLLILTLWILHLSWGTGFYAGIFKFGFPKMKVGTVFKDILGKRTP
jgi:hypothetical protein